MIDGIDLANILFLDIETVSTQASFDQLSEDFQGHWAHKARQQLRLSEEEMTEELVVQAYQDKAAIFAEFGKIVCISVGIMHRDKQDQQLRLRLKSYADDDEKKLLEAFSTLLEQYYTNKYLCGHNIKEFDIPYICRRMLVHQMDFPRALQIQGKKPWETQHLLDTLELWKFGDRKNFTSLKVLATLLDFPSPKDDIDGSQVGRVYWQEQDLNRIAFYCEKDVLATVQLFLRLRRIPILEEGQVAHVDRSAD
jgi:predicted PolB exonuclease-like 3'-5' exonuclease